MRKIRVTLKENMSVKNLKQSLREMLLSQDYLVEAVAEVSDGIMAILKAFDIEIPSEFTITDIRPAKSDAKLLSYLDMKSNKRYEGKPGKVLKKLIPNISDNVLSKIVDKYFAVSGQAADIIVDKKVDKWYDIKNVSSSVSPNSSLGNSCMTGKGLTAWYDSEGDDINIATMLDEEGKLIARAILWNNLKDESGKRVKMMDRIYTHNEKNVQVFKEWAKKNGYLTKKKQSYDDANIFDSGKEVLFFETSNLEKYNGKLPFMDTMKYVYFDTETEKYLLCNDKVA